MTGHPVERRRLLAIDDSVSYRVLLRHVLAKHNVTLLTVESGVEGIEAARHYVPDGILLDLHMPGLDGERVIAMLQEHPATKGIPIVVITGDPDPAIHERARALGARSVLEKPEDIENLAQDVLVACGLL